MGLFDALFSGSQDGGGGLLDFLRANALNQQMPSGLPSDRAQYSAPPQSAPPMFAAQAPVMPQQNARPSPLDSAQWPAGPIGAPSQANAQMIPQQPPAVIQAQPMQQPAPPAANISGYMDRLDNGGGLISSLFGESAQQKQQTQLNRALAAALQQKGVDPTAIQLALADPETRKTLITQNFGPQTVQALGNGYVADKNGKISRAYEPEDKIPSGFAKNDSGQMSYIPGGPADPAYQRLVAAKAADPNAVFVLGRGGELYKKDEKGNVTVVHKNESGEEGVPLTEAAIDFAAKRAIAGDPKALTNLGRGQQGRADLAAINNRIGEIMKDNPDGARTILDNVAKQAGLVSSSRALGTKETHFGVAEKAMEESIPLAQAASDAVPRSDWMHVNMMMQAGQKEHSNPLVKKFLIANDTAVKDYARTINPTGALRESDIEYARKTLSIADGPEAYTAGLQQLQQEAGVMKRAIQRQKAGLYDGRGQPPPTENVVTGAPKPGAYVWSPDKGLVPK